MLKSGVNINYPMREYSEDGIVLDTNSIVNFMYGGILYFLVIIYRIQYRWLVCHYKTGLLGNYTSSFECRFGGIKAAFYSINVQFYQIYPENPSTTAGYIFDQLLLFLYRIHVSKHSDCLWVLLLIKTIFM